MLKPGDKVSGHVLHQVCGEGPFGTTWKAESQGTYVRIKLLHPDFIRRPEGSGALHRLSAALQYHARLPHTHVARVFGMISDPQRQAYGVVSEWVDGFAISDLVVSDAAKEGEEPTELARLLFYFEELGDTLQHLHGHQVVHGNLKPANVLVIRGDFGLVPKLLDLSWSAIGVAARPDSLISPEQYAGQVPSFASDQWAFGALLSGCLRRGDGSFGALPTALTEAVERMSAAQPRHRFPEMGEAVAVLRAARSGLERARLIKSRRDDSVAAAPPVPSARRMRHTGPASSAYNRPLEPEPPRRRASAPFESVTRLERPPSRRPQPADPVPSRGVEAGAATEPDPPAEPRGERPSPAGTSPRVGGPLASALRARVAHLDPDPDLDPGSMEDRGRPSTASGRRLPPAALATGDLEVNSAGRLPHDSSPVIELRPKRPLRLWGAAAALVILGAVAYAVWGEDDPRSVPSDATELHSQEARSETPVEGSEPTEKAAEPEAEPVPASTAPSAPSEASRADLPPGQASCLAGDSDGCFAWGEWATDQGRVGDARRAYHRACRQGQGTACWEAMRWWSGSKSPGAEERALEYLEWGCELDLADACEQAARRHRTGLATEPNPAEAQRLRAKACGLGRLASCGPEEGKDPTSLARRP